MALCIRILALARRRLRRSRPAFIRSSSFPSFRIFHIARICRIVRRLHAILRFNALIILIIDRRFLAFRRFDIVIVNIFIDNIVDLCIASDRFFIRRFRPLARLFRHFRAFHLGHFDRFSGFGCFRSAIVARLWAPDIFCLFATRSLLRGYL